jgi:hypothetical protein
LDNSTESSSPDEPGSTGEAEKYAPGMKKRCKGFGFSCGDYKKQILY